LFSYVREEKLLTYDANVQFCGGDSLLGGWYQVIVTSSPQKVQNAIRACKESLLSLRSLSSRISYFVASETTTAKQAILSKLRSESLSSTFWLDLMSSAQLAGCQFGMSLSEIEHVLQKISSDDVQLVIDCVDFDETNMTSCVAIADR
jgi:predicted Zn-dependent peptidase